MYRFLSLIYTLLLVAAASCLAGCGSNDSNNAAAEQPAAITATAADDDAMVDDSDSDAMQDDAMVVNKVPEVLEIHQINVDHGDAAMIVLRDSLGKITSMNLIDFGDFNYYKGNALAPHHDLNPIDYLLDQGFFTHDINGYVQATKAIDRVIISHLDKDHYKGLKDFYFVNNLVINEVIYPGGFKSGLANNLMTHTPGKTDYLPYVNNKKEPVELRWIGLNLFPDKRIKKWTTTKTLIGGSPIVLGKVNGVNVTMEMVTGSAWVRGDKTRSLGKNLDEGNDYSLSWVLQYGKFRYFSGGDLGGYTKTYADHETGLATLFASKWQGDSPADPMNHPIKNYDGHMCVMKSNHHGSGQSNNTAFLNCLAPAAIVTSCGNTTKHNLPNAQAMTRMSNAKQSPADTQRDVFFTNLYWSKVTPATNTFAGKAGLHYDGHVVVSVDHSNIANESSFQVQLINNGTVDTTVFYDCHQ